MTNKYSALIIDTHNLFYRVFYSQKKLQGDSSIWKITVKSVMEYIEYLKEKYLLPHGEIYFCFDNHDSKVNLRCELSDDYKKNRKQESEQFYNTVEAVKNLLLSYDDSFKVVYIPELEADDLVLPLIDDLISNHTAILMISTDLDWARCIGYKGYTIHWLKGKDTILDKQSFLDYYKFSPTIGSVCLFKAISGDSSDNISPSVPNLRKEYLYKICNTFDNVYTFLGNYKKLDFLSDRMKKVIEENREKIVHNWQLVSFSPMDNFNKITEYVHNGSFKAQFLKAMFKTFDIPISIHGRLYSYVLRETAKNNKFKFQHEKRKRI